MLLGSHVSMSGKKMLEGSAIEAHEYGETTFMIYTVHLKTRAVKVLKI